VNFQWPYNTIKDRFILGDHLTLTLPLLAPLFCLWSDVRMLLIFQAFWVSFSALAIYKIALLRLSKPNALTILSRSRYDCQWTAICLAIVYSLFYGIQYLVYFDFHPVVIGMGVLAWTAYFLESGKTRRIIIAVASQQNFVPHLSHRNQIYLVWPRMHDFSDKPCGQTSCWWLDFDKQAEYLVVDTRPDQWLTQILETNDHWLEAIGNMEKSGRITITESVGAAKLYRIVLQ